MTLHVSPPEESIDFLDEGGELGALMRRHDWTTSPLGPPSTWPQSLRSVVGLLLHSRFPMFLAWGAELTFLYNDAYAEILGEKHPRALGARFKDIWSEIWTEISPLIDAAMAGQATYCENLPLVMNRKGFDEQTWFTFSYSPLRDEQGAVAGMFCAVSETTNTVLAEYRTKAERAEALAERNLLADIVESTDAFVQISDLEYNWLGINRAAADEFERIYGVRPAVGDNMLALLADYPEHQAEVRRIWSRALAGEEFTEIGEFGDPGLARHSYEMKYNTLRGPDGRVIGAFQFVQDVTERQRDQLRLKEAEEALHQSQKMEAIGQMVSGLAHDFNNLLAVVVGSFDLIRRKADDPDQVRRFADAGQEAAQRGSKLTGQLLAFSRSQRIELRPLIVCDVVENLREMLARTLGPMIDLQLDLDPDRVPVLSDATQIEMMILNLAINARDAMPDGGQLRIATAQRRVDDDPELKAGGYVELSVSDTGCGMDPQTLRKALDPFFTTKPAGKGTGLGLSQVYGSARQFGGTVRIESEAGVGTTVLVLLPQTEIAASCEIAADGWNKLAEVNEAKVLVIDDDPDVRQVVVSALDIAGFRVTQAADGPAGLALLKESRPDAAVIDFAMPGMNGAEVAQSARERHPALPIVLISGYADSNAIDRAVEHGARIVRKPFRVDQLLKALNEVLAEAENCRA